MRCKRRMHTMIRQQHAPGRRRLATPLFFCVAGRYHNETRRQDCDPCPANTYQDQENETACDDCPVGYYALEAFAWCTACSSMSTAHVPSVAVCDECTGMGGGASGRFWQSNICESKEPTERTDASEGRGSAPQVTAGIAPSVPTGPRVHSPMRCAGPTMEHCTEATCAPKHVSQVKELGDFTGMPSTLPLPSLLLLACAPFAGLASALSSLLHTVPPLSAGFLFTGDFLFAALFPGGFAAQSLPTTERRPENVKQSVYRRSARLLRPEWVSACRKVCYHFPPPP